MTDQIESAETTRSYYSMMEFIDELKNTFDIENEFDFSILVEKKPIKKKYTFCCKVLAVILGKVRTIYYDELCEKDLQYVDVKETGRRKMGTRNNPWFIDGNSKIQSYKGNEFIEYSFRNANQKDLKFVEKLRKKYNIVPPRDFAGKALHFDDDKLFDEV